MQRPHLRRTSREHELSFAFPNTPAEAGKDILNRHFQLTSRFWKAFWVLLLLFGVGLLGLALRILGGFDDRAAWGYEAALFAYLLTTAQSAPLVSIAMRIVRNHWRRPLARLSEVFAVVGILNLLLFFPLLMTLPPQEGRKSMWFGWPGSPHIYDSLAIIFLVLCGLAILLFTSMPDMAVLREQASGRLKGIARRLSLGWVGSGREWKKLNLGLGYLGALYFILLIGVHALVSMDFAMSLVPGWIDSIFPAFHALSGLQSAVATIIFSMFLMRAIGGYREYFGLDQFWALSKLLLAFSLLWFYFWWSTFWVYWYGRAPSEVSVLKLIMFGPYAVPFFLSFGLNFVVPFGLMLWNVARRSIKWPTIAAASILVGTFFDRIRLYVSAFSVEDVTGHALESIPATHFPDLIDVLIYVGFFSGSILMYMVASKVVPIISMWEVKEWLRLRVVRTFLRTEVAVVAKPE